MMIGAVLFNRRTSDRLFVRKEQPLEEMPQIFLVHLAKKNGEMVDLLGMMGEQWF